MNKTTKELILGEILILLEFLCWWMLKLVFYGNNYFISHWLLVVGIFILFGIVSCLAMLLVKNKKILLGGFFIGLLSFFIFFNDKLIYYAIVLVLLFLAFLFGLRKIRKEEKIQVDLDFWRIFKRGLPIFITALILVASMVYYFSPELMNKKNNKITIPEKTIDVFLKPFEGLIQEKFPLEVNLDSNASKILQNTQIEELQAKFGIKIEKQDTGRQVLYKIIDNQVNNVTGAYQYLIPLGLVIGLFIILKIISILYVAIVIMLSWLTIKILIKLNFVKFEKENREVETISL
ncbi:MAG: hypothetical protein PHT82_02575 [Candidatus Portnoybacteria bacterium]|nr:hypothetical protein [Candidatus Portnoybacteria bacterium]MDD5752394.1 hypothetical protein [Candidatus Portnoybacteria bacterium]